MYTVCVFCGTAAGNDPQYAEATRGMARLLVENGCRVVYGGGKLGLMGIMAQTVRWRRPWPCWPPAGM